MKNHPAYKFAYQNCFKLMEQYTPNPRDFEAEAVEETIRVCRQRVKALTGLMFALASPQPWWSPRRLMEHKLDVDRAYLAMLIAETMRLALASGHRMSELRSIAEHPTSVPGSQLEREKQAVALLQAGFGGSSAVEGYRLALQLLALQRPEVDAADANQLGELLNVNSAQDVRLTLPVHLVATGLLAGVALSLRYLTIYAVTTLVAGLLSKATRALALQKLSRWTTSGMWTQVRRTAGQVVAVALVEKASKRAVAP